MKLHLVLKAKWYDMIVSGEKKEEYREITDYWEARIWANRFVIESIVFHRGYTNITHERELIKMDVDTGREEWGADPIILYYVLTLGEEVK